MSIRNMQYDFKQKINKIDSQQYRNLRIPEIDWKINEGLDIFIKAIAEPRLVNHLGFEVNQRTIDDIRSIVVDNVSLIENTEKENYYLLPDNYMFYLSGKVVIENEACGEKEARLIIQQHDDEFEESPFESSSYAWGEVNALFVGNSLRVFTDGSFTIKELKINFIRKPAYIHNAQDFLPTSSYNLPDGTVLTGRQDCELPEHTHREIVDIAVLITTGDLQIPDYQIKQAKLKMNQIN
jgi:hypothetical protein